METALARPITSNPVTGTTVPGAGSTGPIPLDFRAGNQDTNLTVTFNNGATGTVSVQYTTDDIYNNDLSRTGRSAWTEANANWLPVPNMTGLTTTFTGNLVLPVTAVRMIATVAPVGTVYLRIVQTPNKGS